MTTGMRRMKGVNSLKNHRLANMMPPKFAPWFLGFMLLFSSGVQAVPVFIDYLPPVGATALSGQVTVSGGRLVHISTISKDKTIEANQSNFVVYGLNNLPIFGKITFEIDVGSRYEFNVDIIASDKDGNPLVTSGRFHKEYSYKGVRKVQDEYDIQSS